MQSPPHPLAVGPTPRLACFVGRQPIYDLQLNVIAYELLFRSSETNQAGPLEPFQATAQVLLNTFLEIGLEALVGPKRAFINFSRGFLLLDYMQLFPPDRVGIEVLEGTVVDAELLEAVRQLSARGYTIALDDFILHDHLRPLVELADLIKLDILALERPALEEHVALLRPYGVKLLAEKVETYDQFHTCKALGFDYFQGYFLCQPEIVTGQRSPTNRLALLHLLAEIQRPDLTFEELEALLSQDVSLSYKVLRIANSAFYARLSKIESLKQALLRLGLRTIVTWTSLLLLAAVDDKPQELLRIAMVRAKMCEQLCVAFGQHEGAAAFLVGLLSVLDALLDRPMAELLEALPLAEGLIQALLYHQGVLGQTLHSVLDYERGLWEEVSALQIDPEAIVDAYLTAVGWTVEMGDMLRGA
jgi:EAL and modified HD-GYP domain-containing signal transduction protein